jgi:hypothetical protein
MWTEVLQDMRADIRELPGVATAVVLAVAMGVGLNAAFFCEADGDEVRFSAGRVSVPEERLNMLRSHECSESMKPGFTLIVGLRQYTVELSVPVAGVRTLVDDARAHVASSLRGATTEDLA